MREDSGHPLARIEIFQDLDAAEMDSIEKLCRWRRIKRRENVISSQDDTTDVFFVVQGKVRIVNYSLMGRQVAFEDLGVGRHFGEKSAFDHQLRSANVVTLSECLLAVISAKDFLDIFQRCPSVALNVASDLSRQLRISSDRIMGLATLAAHNRVYANLLSRARLNGGQDPMISPIPSHSEIAAQVSTSRETVARTLSELARTGVVERTKQAIYIRDETRLREMVEEVQGADRRSGADRRDEGEPREAARPVKARRGKSERRQDGDP